MVLVEAKNLTKIYYTFYGKIAALTNLTVNIDEGITAIIGPNGSGKTTFIKIMLGLVKPTSGEIKIFGKKPGYRKRISYLPEKPSFPKSVMVKDLISFISEVRDIDINEIYSTLRKLKMTDFDKKMGTLSAGMVQKVGIAITLTSAVDLAILDEPTANLDPLFRKKVLEMIKKFGEDKNVILATHILEDVGKVADNVMFLLKGKSILYDRVDKLLKDKIYKITFKDGSVKFVEEIDKYIKNVADIDVIKKDLGDVFERTVEMVYK